MAQIQEVRLVDDLDGSEATESIKFAIDGKEYLIDLNSDNATVLRDVFTPYVAAARKASKLSRDVASVLTKAQTRRAAAGPRPAPSLASRTQRNQEIRAWALARGLQVAERGRIPQQVVDAYDAEHGTAAA